MSGHLSSMNTVLKNNRNLRLKKKPFLNFIKKDLKSTRTEIELKKISEDKLLSLKENYIAKNKSYNTKIVIISLLISIPIIIFIFPIINDINSYYTEKYYVEIVENDNIQKKIQTKEQTKKYKHNITEGDKWIEKQHYRNAIYFYENAVEIYPKSFESNYRLTLAYSYNCQKNNKSCEKGKKLNNRLLKHFPDNKNLFRLKYIFDSK